MEAGVARGEGGGAVIYVAVRRAGCSWERHLVPRERVTWFLRDLDRQGLRYRTPSGR